jgi:hypothetical protein
MLFGMTKPAAVLHAKSAIVWLRIASSLAWIASACIGKDATISPAFWHGGEMASRVTQTLIHSALDSRVAQVLTWYVAPHAAVFVLLIGAADVAAGVLLAFGLFVRLGSAIAIARAGLNILVAGGAGTVTIGYNALLIVIAAICIATAAGRRFGIDEMLINRFPRMAVLRLVA